MVIAVATAIVKKRGGRPDLFKRGKAVRRDGVWEIKKNQSRVETRTGVSVSRWKMILTQESPAIEEKKRDVKKEGRGKARTSPELA